MYGVRKIMKTLLFVGTPSTFQQNLLNDLRHAGWTVVVESATSDKLRGAEFEACWVNEGNDCSLPLSSKV